MTSFWLLGSTFSTSIIRYFLREFRVPSTFFRFIGSSRRERKNSQLLWFCFRHRISSENGFSNKLNPMMALAAGGPHVIEGRRALERVPLAVRVRDMTFLFAINECNVT